MNKNWMVSLGLTIISNIAVASQDKCSGRSDLTVRGSKGYTTYGMTGWTSTSYMSAQLSCHVRGTRLPTPETAQDLAHMGTHQTGFNPVWAGLVSNGSGSGNCDETTCQGMIQWDKGVEGKVDYAGDGSIYTTNGITFDASAAKCAVQHAGGGIDGVLCTDSYFFFCEVDCNQ